VKALTWTGVNQLSVEQVADPELLNPGDAIVKVTLTAPCGSDIHLLSGYVPTMAKGDVIGHEFMGEVVETGPNVKKHKKGDRVVVVSVVGCGECFFCKREEWSLCNNTNPNAGIVEAFYGHSPAGIFGYSHAFGGYAGSHAEYVRVPFADQGAFRIPDALSDEQALFVSDAFATGFMAAEMCHIQPGDIVAIWGCGGVGQMAIRSAYLLGAERVIAIDRFEDRLAMASGKGRAETLNYRDVNVLDALREMTGGRGPDACIDAVGLEAHGYGPSYWYDRAKQSLRLETGRSQVLREMIVACRKGGTLSIVGVYGGFLDKLPMGPLMNKGLTVRTGQQHGQRYAERLLSYIEKGEIDPSYLITHRCDLNGAPGAYKIFRDKRDRCMRPVFYPHGTPNGIDSFTSKAQVHKDPSSRSYWRPPN
jgi:threonine dehydrogenase-like Zn-dependent dehydrogenase